MIIKIKREDALHHYNRFPQRTYDYIKEEEDYFYPKVFGNYILTLKSKSVKGHAKLLSTELAILTMNLGFEDLIFLGDNKNYWLTKLSLSREDYKPLKNALEYFMDNKIGKRFNGALVVDNSNLSEFIEHLFYLTRCDASLPYFYFMDKNQNFISNICQYGNVHFDTLNKKTDTHLKQALVKGKFEIIYDKKCFSQFAKTSKIKARHAVV